MSQKMWWLLLCCWVFSLVGTSIGQEATTMSPPKVMIIIRENVKPGKAGGIHEKSESAFVNAFKAAKWPQHYFAADSQSGSSRSLFFIGYNSFADWEKDTQATGKNATLSAALERASSADADLLSSYESSAFVYNEDQSLQAALNIAQMRYFEISRFHLRPGHSKDWEDMVKIYKDGYSKAAPDTHWAVYQEMYGQGGDVYLVFIPMKSLAEVDKGMEDAKKFAAAIGEDGMKRVAELSAAAIDEAQTNVFSFNPRESYVSDEWIKADPNFWKPQPAKAKQ